MKTTTLALAGLLTALGTMNFTCINDSFNVVVNVPVSYEFTVNPGSTGAKSGNATLGLKDYVDASFLDEVKNARLYDIRVSTIGTYSGTISNGAVTVDGQQILVFAGQWNQFNTPQSLLGSSLLVQPRTAGVTALVSKLNQLSSNPNVTAILAASCTVTDASGQVPSGLKVRVELLTQMDAEVTTN